MESLALSARSPHRSTSPRIAQHPVDLRRQVDHEATERPRRLPCTPPSGSRGQSKSRARCPWTHRKPVTGPTPVMESSRGRRSAAGRARVNRGSATATATHRNCPSAYPRTTHPPPPPKSSAQHSGTNSPLVLIRRCRLSKQTRRQAQPNRIGDLTLTASGGSVPVLL